MASENPMTPWREMDAEAEAIIRDLLNHSRHAALAVTDPTDGHPNISRIAFARSDTGQPMSLISDLSLHASALKSHPQAAILLGEPGDKGDPLTHPRLSLRVAATFIRHGDPDHRALADQFLRHQPKAKLYIDFADFSIVTFCVQDGLLNGGFGKAYPLTAQQIVSL